MLKLELLVGLVVMLEEFWYEQQVVVFNVGTLRWRLESLTFAFGVEIDFCVIDFMVLVVALCRGCFWLVCRMFYCLCLACLYSP